MRLVKNKQLASAFRWVSCVALVEWESLVLSGGVWWCTGRVRVSSAQCGCVVVHW